MCRKMTLLLVVLLLVGVSGLASGAILETYYNLDGDLLNSVAGAPDGTATTETYVAGSPYAPLGSAIRFDGTVNTLVTTTTGGHPIAGTGLEVGSIAFWLRQDASATAVMMVTGVVNAAPTASQGFQLHSHQAGADHWRLWIRDKEGDVFMATNGTNGATWRDGLWHHHAWTWDTVDKTATSYVDGVAQTLTINSVPDVDGLVAWNVNNAIGGGNNRGALADLLTGDIDDYRVYSDVLTQSDVNILIPEPATVALLSMGYLWFCRFRRRRR